MSFTIWLTGLPGAGKTTLAQKLYDRAMGRIELLDGDDFRRSPLGRGLGFSPEDRLLNLERAATVAGMLNYQDVMVICAFITPLESMREAINRILGERLILIHVATPQATCEARDPKGLYKAAREGLLPDLTGVGAPYEVPVHPALTVDGTDTNEAANQIIDYLTRAAGTK